MGYRAILDPPVLAHALRECGSPGSLGGLRERAQEADGRQLRRLLRTHRQRPRCRCAAEQRNQPNRRDLN
jgi:hypothetical protein